MIDGTTFDGWSGAKGFGSNTSPFTLAEKTLLEARKLFVATRGEEHKDTHDRVQALIDFYEARADAAPGKGHEPQATRWKVSLDTGAE